MDKDNLESRLMRRENKKEDLARLDNCGSRTNEKKSVLGKRQIRKVPLGRQRV